MSKKGAISQFIEKYYLHFNSATVVDAAKEYENQLASGKKMLVSLAGAMSTAELGKIFAEIIRQDKVQIISCTGANLEEDIMNLVAHSHYKRVPNYRDLTPKEEWDLLENHYNRVTDTCIPEEEAFKIIYQKKDLGTYGLVSKSLNKKFGISQNVYLAELNWNMIVDHAYTNTLTYEEVAKYPMVKRDFALLLDESVSFEDLQKVALNTNKKILKEVQLFDVYEGKSLDKGKKSYGLSFTFQDKNKTLTDKQIDKIMSKLQANFEKQLNAELR